MPGRTAELARMESVGPPLERRDRAPSAHGLTEDQANDVLLAFARLTRGAKGPANMPRRLQALLDASVLAPRHLRVLAVVTLAGPMTISELANRENLALSTSSLLVTQLAEAGLVERREDEADRRRTVVSIAPDFRRESESVLAAKLAPIRRALARLGPEQTDGLLKGLGILAEEVARSESSTKETIES
jgi:DNA-binding MarR family transcriptional regulator